MLERGATFSNYSHPKLFTCTPLTSLLVLQPLFSTYLKHRLGIGWLIEMSVALLVVNHQEI